MELINKKEYIEYSIGEKEAYIKEILGIYSFRMLGHPAKDLSCIEEIVSYDNLVELTGERLLVDMKDTSNNALYRFLGKEKDYDWVIFDLELINEANLIQKNKLFKTRKVTSVEAQEVDLTTERSKSLIDDLYVHSKSMGGKFELLTKLTDEIKTQLDTAYAAEQNKIEEMHTEKKEKIQVLENLTEKTKIHEEKLQTLLEKEKQLEKIDWLLPKDKVDESMSQAESSDFSTISNWLKEVRKQLQIRGLFFNEAIIRQVVYSLFANELLILTGPSGTGKTSLLVNLAEIMGVQIYNIPVQPNWHDKQDLLGFYNPLSNIYTTTPFLDAVMAAREHPDQLHIINLDEINLAKVEYYLADLLSALELDEAELVLYSKQEYEKNTQELRDFLTFEKLSGFENVEEILEKEIGIQDYIQLKARYQNLTRYPYKINFPENIRIVGTMNVEGLVEPLSGKVIDRSFVFPLEDQPITENVEAVEEKNLARPASVWQRKKEMTWETEVNSYLNRKFEHLFSDLNRRGIHMQYRMIKHMRKYLLIALSFTSEEEKMKSFQTWSVKNEKVLDQLVDDLLLGKILPKIHHVEELYEEETLTGILRGHISQEKYPRSYQKLIKMIDNAEKNSMLSFWS